MTRAKRRKDDNEPITYAWVSVNFPSMGAAFSARQHGGVECLVWQNRFERFTLYGHPQNHLKTRGDVRCLVAALGVDLPLDQEPPLEGVRHDWLET